jgi:hypothetical protein
MKDFPFQSKPSKGPEFEHASIIENPTNLMFTSENRCRLNSY